MSVANALYASPLVLAFSTDEANAVCDPDKNCFFILNEQSPFANSANRLTLTVIFSFSAACAWNSFDPVMKNLLPIPFHRLCRRWLVTLLGSSLHLFSLAQDYIDPVRISYTHGVHQQYTNSSEQAPFSELAVDLTTPIVINEKTALVTGALLEQTHFGVGPESTAVDVYGTMLKLGINHKHSEKWSGTYLLLPKLSSDLKRIAWKDMQVGALALVKYHPRKNLNYRLGAYLNSDLFGPMVVPIAGVYLLHNRWEINAALPITADVNYRLNNHMKLGAKFIGINKSYFLNHGGGDTYTEKVNNELGTYLEWASGPVHFRLLAGHSIARSTRIYHSEDQIDLSISALKFGNHRTPLNTTFGDGLILKASLFYRIHTA